MTKNTFVINMIFHKEEGKNIEFKEVKSEKPVRKIANHAEEYIVGFLNSSLPGDLYFGIDDSGTVIGVRLSRGERDELQKDIPNKLRQIQPTIAPSFYDLSVHDIYNEEKKIIENLCVVQIHVQKSELDCLYSTAGGGIYMKKGTTCIKLTNEEINKEYETRKLKRLAKRNDEIDKELQQNPNSLELLKKKADIARDMGNIDALDQTYKKLLKLEPNNSKTFISYASAHKRNNDLGGALEILDKALKSKPSYPSDILKTKGSFLLDSKRTDEALQSFREALRLDPNNYTIMTQIGISLRELGQYRESIKFFDLALAIAPRYRVAKYEKKLTYSKMVRCGISFI